MKSFYVISKEGNGAVFVKGETVKFMYEVYMSCPDPGIEECKRCHEGHRSVPIESSHITVTLGDGVLHRFIEDTLLNQGIRRGGSLHFYITAEDAFEEVGVNCPARGTVVSPNCPLCFKIEDVLK